jgi:stage III sporulation protein AG
MSEGFWQGIGKSLFQGEGRGKGPRSTFLLVALAALGMVFMFLSAKPMATEPVKPPGEISEVVVPFRAKEDYREILEKDLAAMLHRVKGVGEVAVFVTLDSGPVYQYGENEETTGRSTREEDSGGGSRSIEETTVSRQIVVTRENNTDKPVITREIQPAIRGVIVIAEGAENPVLREQIARALQAGLNIAAHRITVLPMK